MTDFDAKIIELSKKNEDEKIEQLFEERLKQEPANIVLLLRLTVLEINPPFVDYKKCFECLERVFSLNKDNAIALLLLAYVCTYVWGGGIDEVLKNRLITLHTPDAELNSMLKYTASWFYDNIHENNDPKREEELLQESINLYQGHVWNYVHLADLYINQGHDKEAKELLETALRNVRKIYSDQEIAAYDSTNIDDFLAERIQGIYLTKDNFELINERLEKVENVQGRIRNQF